jgi:hypothetical protein
MGPSSRVATSGGGALAASRASTSAERAPRGRISLMIEEEVERVAEARARSAEVDARDAASAPPPEVATRDDGPILSG